MFWTNVVVGHLWEMSYTVRFSGAGHLSETYTQCPNTGQSFLA